LNVQQSFAASAGYVTSHCQANVGQAKELLCGGEGPRGIEHLHGGGLLHDPPYDLLQFSIFLLPFRDEKFFAVFWGVPHSMLPDR
jgi:hypothetical protein